MSTMPPPDARAQQRHDEILGRPARVDPLDRQAAADLVHAATMKLRGNVVGDSAPMPLEAIPEIMFVMGKFTGLWEKIMDLTVQIQGPESVLPARDRKLAILRTGWLCQAPYEFGEHVSQSKRIGLTSEEIEQVIVGSSATQWNDHERAILKAVEELHDDAALSDATWDQLAKRYSEHQLVELLILIGQFTATAYFQNAMRLPIEKNNQGLFAR